MAVVVGFHFDVISCEPAYGMARPRPAAAAESSACGHGQAVGSDLDPRSMVVFSSQTIDREAIRNESVPKIIINDTINLFFKLKSAFR